MPFLRYARDKRGYETTYVMHTYRPSSGGNGDARILYMFRSPAHVAVGRRALDDEARAGLEHTHPDLSFDWHTLLRDATAAPRPSPGREPRPAPRAARPAPPTPPAAPPDESVLGRVLGTSEAARLRAGYADLVQRVVRRSRSPEERDQLAERLRRLNPDDWADEGAVRAGVSTVEAEWDAIRAALPARRRGRRGGRRPEERPAGPARPASGIIAEGGDTDARQEEAQMDRADRSAGHPGDDDRVGRSGSGDGLPGDD